jgi:(S)-2-hydroxyglutarate dehydrogenase
MSRRFDVAVVGGGIIGLATAYRLLEKRPGLRLAVLEKEAELALHQSGHNSGVLHAGLYYPAGSRKAELCREGKAAIEAFCATHGIAIARCGKLVVAVNSDELPGLQEIARRAEANGVPGLERIGPERMAEIEPHVAGLAGLYSPETSVVDFRLVALALADEVRARGGEVRTGWAVEALEHRPAVGGEELVIRSVSEELVAGAVISCAGLWSDRVAALTGSSGTQRIVPFRGDYMKLRPQAHHLVRGLIYPVNDPRFPFLGIHLTRRIDGEVWAGPNAVLAFARAGYRIADLEPRDLAETLSYRGFLRLAFKYWQSGAGEMWRDVWPPAFAAAVRRYVPELRDEDLEPGPSGVRAQSVRVDGQLVDDFSFGGSGRIIHVRNAPSPGATASLAIGRFLAEMAEKRFELA